MKIKKVPIIEKNITLDKFYRTYKKVLIKRDLGGLGDIFMHRMLFEDFKRLLPTCHLTFACPKKYHSAVIDHPFLDEIVDCTTVDINDYGIVYNTSTYCNFYEIKHAPYCDKHRSDIWADWCGLTLQNHNMHFFFLEEEKIKLDKPTVAIAPISAMESKNLFPDQINPVIEELQQKNYDVVIVHDRDLPEYATRTISNLSIRQLMAFINAVDYVITVDTSIFHLAGGLGKPMLAVFGWADGKVYGKYFSNMVLLQKHREDDPTWTCGPCYNFGLCPKVDGCIMRKPCITEITAAMILKLIRERFL